MLNAARHASILKTRKDSVSQSPCAIGAAKIARACAWIKDAVDRGLDTPGGFGGGRVIEFFGQPVEHQGRGKIMAVGLARPLPMMSGAVP